MREVCDGGDSIVVDGSGIWRRRDAQLQFRGLAGAVIGVVGVVIGALAGAWDRGFEQRDGGWGRRRHRESVLPLPGQKQLVRISESSQLGGWTLRLKISGKDAKQGEGP